jgi:hypothetical protein
LPEVKFITRLVKTSFKTELSKIVLLEIGLIKIDKIAGGKIRK